MRTAGDVHGIEVLIDRGRQLIAGLPADERHQLEGLLRELLGRMSRE